ncbi:apolipoprotein D-like [Ruditapes philippinarum]|uniref:apolipoprotein D-like n=1 Tax=Ruditapes philippinarum TaxID=129788 RepID=UPI00295AE436|nr:apolipoprotein D-like [Ruditapes philippinarum]
MALMKFAAFILTLSIAYTQEVHFGKCKNFTTQPNFDVKRYAGGWYDIEKTYFAGQMNKSCVKAEYSLRDDGKIDVLNQDYTAELHEENTTGIAFYKDPNVKSKLTVKLGTSPEANYWIVETDYDTYALIWSCAELEGIAHADIGWILGRKQRLDENLITRLKQKLTSLGLNYEKFYRTKQPLDTCPW